MGSSPKFCLVDDGTADIQHRLGPTMRWDVAVQCTGDETAKMDGTDLLPLGYG